MKSLLKKNMAAAVGLAASVVLTTGVSARTYTMEIAGTSGCTGSTGLPLVKYAKNAGVDIQLATGKTLTKSGILVAQGKLDFSTFVPFPYVLMQRGAAMYKKLGAEKGKKLAANLRGLFGFECGVYTPVVWADSGITKWEQFKGKRIFTGPPSGAAAQNSEQFIRVMTGFEPNKDYEAVRLAWGGGQQAMRDGQLDVYMRPLQVPSAMVEELMGVRQLRFLSISDDKLNSPAMKKYIGAVGRYPGRINVKQHYGDGVLTETEEIRLPAFALIKIVGHHVDEAAVYNVTKAFWENAAEIRAGDRTLGSLLKETAFIGLNIPLHVGAYKYYQEAGFDVPADLIPPELK